MRRDSEVMVVPLCILAAACTGFIVELFGIAEQYGIVLLSLFLLFTVGYFVFHHNREKQIEADIRRAAEEKKQREYEHLLDRHRACLEKLAWCTAEYNRYFRGQGKQRRSPSAVETARQKAELERQLYRIEESIALLGFLPPGQCELARTAAQFRQDRAHTGK